MEAYCMKCKTQREVMDARGILQRQELAGDGRRLSSVRHQALSDGPDSGA